MSTVTVASKIPQAILIGGIRINGTNREPLSSPNAANHPMVGAWAITDNVPEDAWNDWFNKNQKSYMIANGMIWACADARAARLRAGGVPQQNFFQSQRR